MNPQEQSIKLHEELPKSKLKVIEKAGHMLHYSAPLVVIGEIEGAMKQPASV